MIVVALTALAIGAAPQAGRKDSYREEARAAYLAQALAVVRRTPPDALEHAYEYARVLEQGACSSSVERLKVECLMTAARRYCKRKSAEEVKPCQATMDVVVSNVLASRRLISFDRRYEIMKRFKDPRRELLREMRRIQGALAADFHLRMGEATDDPALAKDIDRYCLTTADETNVAWQSCASSIVWFIATGSSSTGTEK